MNSNTEKTLSERYQILSIIGEGSRATVYKAVDRDVPGTIVALKVLRSEVVGNQIERERFQQEILLGRSFSSKYLI